MPLEWTFEVSFGGLVLWKLYQETSRKCENVSAKVWLNGEIQTGYMMRSTFLHFWHVGGPLGEISSLKIFSDVSHVLKVMAFESILGVRNAKRWHLNENLKFHLVTWFSENYIKRPPENVNMPSRSLTKCWNPDRWHDEIQAGRQTGWIQQEARVPRLMKTSC